MARPTEVAPDGRTCRYRIELIRDSNTSVTLDVGVSCRASRGSSRLLPGSPLAFRLLHVVRVPRFVTAFSTTNVTYPTPDVAWLKLCPSRRLGAFGDTVMNKGKWQWDFLIQQGAPACCLLVGCSKWCATFFGPPSTFTSWLTPENCATSQYLGSEQSCNNGVLGPIVPNVKAATGTTITFTLDFTCDARGGVLSRTLAGETTVLFTGLRGEYRPFVGCPSYTSAGTIQVQMTSLQQLD